MIFDDFPFIHSHTRIVLSLTHTLTHTLTRYNSSNYIFWLLKLRLSQKLRWSVQVKVNSFLKCSLTVREFIGPTVAAKKIHFLSLTHRKVLCNAAVHNNEERSYTILVGSLTFYNDMCWRGKSGTVREKNGRKRETRERERALAGLIYFRPLHAHACSAVHVWACVSMPGPHLEPSIRHWPGYASHAIFSSFELSLQPKVEQIQQEIIFGDVFEVQIFFLCSHFAKKIRKKWLVDCSRSKISIICLFLILVR